MKEKVFHVVGMISLFLFIVSLSIVLTINLTPLYAFDIDYLKISQNVGLSKETLMENYRVLLNYLNLPWVTELNFLDFPSSESGLFHFYEVKRLFILDYVIAMITAVSSFFYLRYIKKNKLFWKLVRPFQVAIAVPFVVLFMIAVSFDQLFVAFHKVFFNNDAWLFNPSTDPIILALPETFFMHCFILAFVFIELQIIFGYFYTKRKAFH
ncbi:TIGR01906 family membrane protein [Carnobacterium viridans]|uniref:Integral membrane protein TIGR01906 n=1 Tax=Carnobacterium viridans TaxID=174587 RepID=A0A1H1B077_9LACT|nr:TIGR01906 family membrane protein [Carnobacterium viridans]UDE95986.1 TIGR01906 family membrane protein [Carnobacterium viridans]SDQ45171.1 integral membrane protein TIGR01906 [Carnobacterium viridans]